MRKLARVVIATLFLQLFVGSEPAQAAPTLRITGVAVNGNNVTVKWASPKITPKEYFIVEFTKLGSTPKKLKTKTQAIIAKLDDFSKYQVRVSRSLSPTKRSSSRSFTITAPTITGIAI